MDKKQKQRADVEIDIIPLLKVLLSKLWLMVLVGAIVATATFCLTKLFIKPTYRSGFTAYVNNQHAQADKSTLSNQDLIAAQQLTKTFSYIIRSNTVLSAALESIHSDLTYGDISGMVTTEIKEDTELISVFVTNQDKELAYKLADAIAKTAPKYMAQIVEGSSMKIVDYPEMAEHRYGPSYVKYAIFGFLAGFLIVLIKLVISYFMDDKIKSETDIEERFDIPILGIIPDIITINKSKGYYGHDYGYQQSSAGSERKDERK